MDKDAQTLASEALMAANRELMADTQAKLAQLQELSQEFEQLFAQQHGIAPEGIASFLEQALTGEQIANLKAQFEAEVGSLDTLSEGQPAPASAPAARRPGRRNIV
jgi:hypothetical protein